MQGCRHHTPATLHTPSRVAQGHGDTEGVIGQELRDAAAVVAARVEHDDLRPFRVRRARARHDDGHLVTDGLDRTDQVGVLLERRAHLGPCREIGARHA